jgi:hypothetical protein
MDDEYEAKSMTMAKTKYKIESVVPVSPNTVLLSPLGGAEFWNTKSWEYESKIDKAKGSCAIYADKNAKKAVLNSLSVANSLLNRFKHPAQQPTMPETDLGFDSMGFRRSIGLDY